MHQNYLEGLLKPRLLDPTLRVVDLVGLGWGPLIYIFNDLSGDPDAASLGTSLRSTGLKHAYQTRNRLCIGIIWGFLLKHKI